MSGCETSGIVIINKSEIYSVNRVCIKKNNINKTAEYILNKLYAVEILIMRYDRLTHDNTVRRKIF